MIDIFGYGITFLECYIDTHVFTITVLAIEYKYEDKFSVLKIGHTYLEVLGVHIIVPVGNRGKWKWGWQ